MTRKYIIGFTQADELITKIDDVKTVHYVVPAETYKLLEATLILEGCRGVEG